MVRASVDLPNRWADNGNNLPLGDFQADIPIDRNTVVARRHVLKSKHCYHRVPDANADEGPLITEFQSNSHLLRFRPLAVRSEIQMSNLFIHFHFTKCTSEENPAEIHDYDRCLQLAYKSHIMLITMTDDPLALNVRIIWVVSLALQATCLRLAHRAEVALAPTQAPC